MTTAPASRSPWRWARSRQTSAPKSSPHTTAGPDAHAASTAAALLAAEGHGPERQARGAANHRALFADWGGQPAWDYGRRGLRALDLPLRVLSSSHAGPHERAAADTLAGLAPQAVRWDGAAADAIRDLLGAAAVTRRA